MNGFMIIKPPLMPNPQTAARSPYWDAVSSMRSHLRAGLALAHPVAALCAHFDASRTTTRSACEW
jgi:hypothetical protein